jgi:hypothetical protein
MCPRTKNTCDRCQNFHPTPALASAAPAIRASASRCTPILGTDYLADDTDWKPAFFRHEFVGEKKMLVPFMDEKIAYTEGARDGYIGGDLKPGGAFPGWPKPNYNKWQLRKVYLVNFKPTEVLGRGYCYSERIF